MTEQIPEETPTEPVVQEVELDEAAVDSIADKALEKMTPKFEELFKGLEDRISARSEEKTVSKNVNGGASSEDNAAPAVIINGVDIEKMTPEMRFARQVQARLTNDAGALKAYQDHAFEAREKAGYNNETVSSEGGFIVLQPEFEAEIERLLPQVGGIAGEVAYRDLPGNSVITNKGTNNVEFSKVLEGAAKPAKKSAFSQQTVALNKYAAILLASSELLEDQATDFWQDARDQYAYAYGKKIDEMVLTDNGTTASEKGLLHTAGVTLEPTSGAGSTVTWDDLLNAKYAVPGEAAPGGIYVMHRSTLNVLRQLKGVSNDYLQQGTFIDGSGNPTTPWGDRIVLTDTMPINGSSWDGTTVGAGVIYGNFSRYAKVYRKAGGLQLSVSDTATVVDNAGVTKNLWQDNLVGMRAEFRATFFAKFPEAFAIIGATPLS